MSAEERSLPEGWADAQLDETAVLIQGQSPPGELVKDGIGELPFFQGKSEFGKVSPVPRKCCAVPPKIAEGGDILLSIRAPVGPTNFADRICGIGRGLVAIRATIGVERNFLLWQMRNLEAWLGQQGTGSTFQAVSGDFVRKIRIPLAPLAEQKVIADTLDVLLAQVDTLQARLDAIPAILKRFRQSVLSAAVTGKLTEEWRADQSFRNPEVMLNSIQTKKNEWISLNSGHNEISRIKQRISKFDVSVCSQDGVPNSWIWCALEDACLMVVDCHNKTAPYSESGIPLIRTPNVRDGNFVWDDLRYVDEKTYEYWSKRCIPEAGDIIFTREAPMGELAIIPESVRLCLGQRTMLIRVLESSLLAKYLQCAMQDVGFKTRSDAIAVGTGVKHLRVGDVGDLQIPLPPLPEQHEIVRRVEELFALADQIEKRVEEARSRAKHLTQSILAKAFRGELTAQWRAEHPELVSGENSAQALLERIRAARAQAPEKGKRGRPRKG